MKIAITGGAGSGKSTIISRVTGRIPANIISFDNIVKELYANDEEWKKYLRDKFGTDIKDQVSSIVFSNPHARSELMSKSAIKLGFMLGTRMSNCNASFQLVEFPLLFESGMSNVFDKVILITADTQTRVKRIVDRSNGEVSEDKAHAIILSQMSEQEKSKMSHYVIDTSNSLDRSIDSLVNELSGVLLGWGFGK